jgi:hypothetical protein
LTMPPRTEGVGAAKSTRRSEDCVIRVCFVNSRTGKTTNTTAVSMQTERTWAELFTFLAGHNFLTADTFSVFYALDARDSDENDVDVPDARYTLKEYDRGQPYNKDVIIQFTSPAASGAPTFKLADFK